MKVDSMGMEECLERRGNPVARGANWRSASLGLLVLAGCVAFSSELRAQLIVDCTGATPGAYTTINAALANVTGSGGSILVSGTCSETVALNNVDNLSLGAFWGQTANLIGSISINGSDGVYLYGLNVSNPSGNGFNINSSRAITLDSCTGNANSVLGLSAGGLSEVTLVGPTSFDFNGQGGIRLVSHSTLEISDYAGATDISNNQGPGIWMTQGSLVNSLGSLTLENNVNLPGTSNLQAGFGLTMFGASIAQFGTCTGPNLIANNQSGGISLEENSELSLWDCVTSYRTSIVGNGGAGLTAGFGSQVTLADIVQITGHAGPAVDLFGSSQLYATGANVLSQNGTASDPRSAAIRLDGNSEGFLRGGQIQGNQGPGILALVGSTADFTGVTFTGNSGGIITCDSSAFMVSDLSGAAGGHGVSCHTPHALGNRHQLAASQLIPDFTPLKNRQALYRKMATPKGH